MSTSRRVAAGGIGAAAFALLLASACSGKTDDSSDESASAETTSTASETSDSAEDEDGMDGAMKMDFGNGTSEYCAARDEEACLESNWTDGRCFPVSGHGIILHGSYWCEGDSTYLGCIDTEDIGCGVEFLCRDGKQWWATGTACVPPGFEVCEGPEEEYGGEAC